MIITVDNIISRRRFDTRSFLRIRFITDRSVFGAAGRVSDGPSELDPEKKRKRNR